jgi:hypothetical protein
VLRPVAAHQGYERDGPPPRWPGMGPLQPCAIAVGSVPLPARVAPVHRHDAEDVALVAVLDEAPRGWRERTAAQSKREGGDGSLTAGHRVTVVAPPALG